MSKVFIIRNTLVSNVTLETKMVNNIPHCLFLNPFTLKIHCFECNCEVHDFELYNAFFSAENYMLGWESRSLVYWNSRVLWIQLKFETHLLLF